MKRTNFVSWLEGGLAEVSADDISAAGNGLEPVGKDEKVIGDLSGDLIRFWAMMEKWRREQMEWSRAEIMKLASELGTANEIRGGAVKIKLNELRLARERGELLAMMFWHNVRAELGEAATPVIGLRADMKLVQEEPEEEAEISIGVPIFISRGGRK